jgi:sarcosine oxidase
MGSATLYQLARRKARVLGIDRFTPPHAMGSSHGDTRITRKAIGEGDAYVPLVLRSHEIWRELEAEAGTSLLTVTGGLWISSPGRRAETHVKDFFDNTVAAARKFGIAHEVLDAVQIRSGFPQFRVAGNETGYYEPDAGFLRPEACIATQLGLARSLGATTHLGERVRAIEPEGGGVRVTTDRGQYVAAQVVLSAGAWVTQLLPPYLAQLFTITRQVIYWFDAGKAYPRFAPPRFPVWIWELQDEEAVIYGFPAIDGPAGGAKVATEQYRQLVRREALDNVDRSVSEAEAADMHRKLVAPYLPDLGQRLVKAASCLYTATADFQFVVDRLPEMPQVNLASPCSGHGFKHSAALGEALAAMALGTEPGVDLRPFSLRRFERLARLN